MGLPTLPNDQAVDTLAIARKKFPGSPVSLDALCRRFDIDNSARTLHGALLDSEILAEVYLELIGGRQPDFGLQNTASSDTTTHDGAWTVPKRPKPLPLRLTDAERAAHAKFLEKLADDTLWAKN